MNAPRASTSDAYGRERSTSFEALTRPFPEACLLVSASGRILAQNAKAVRVLGTRVGSRLSDRSPDSPERLAAYLEKCSGSGTLLPGRITFRGPDGSPAEYRAEGAAIAPDETDEPRRIILRLREHRTASRRFLLLNQKVADLTREIHDRMAAEEELRQQTHRLHEKTVALEEALTEVSRQKRIADHANRRKSEFLATMSHELRTPLHAIVGYAALLEKGVNAGGIARIRRAADHLNSIIETILTFSRLEAGKEEAAWDDADAVRIAADALELVAPSAREEGLVPTFDAPDEPILVRTDPAKVRQILVNLLSNAIKFTEEGGFAVTVTREGDVVRFDVQDSGVGIRPEELEQIFEPFWQADSGFDRKSSGTGLGLTVTRRLARLLGGDIRAESEPGHGSTFTLVLPLRPTPGQDVGSEQPAPSLPS